MEAISIARAANAAHYEYLAAMQRQIAGMRGENAEMKRQIEQKQ